jgi:acyl carrier protein phosphodiesterase
MNYLAHLYLGSVSRDAAVGSILADFLKGRPSPSLPPQILSGIAHHLAIDDFTDRHPLVKKSRARLFPKFAHYSSVITDVYYDHFLASQWARYSEESLEDFALRSYRVLQRRRMFFPMRAQHMFLLKRFRNLLVSYATIEGVDFALTRIASRTRFRSKMEFAAYELEENYAYYQKEFHVFFKDLRTFSDEFLQQRNAE